ncbi:fibronectin type III domain-containing protein [Candidatus Collierbacteria bacterium]|nr:fibronectin type III domain-containing protein [Candidatus Collierbacteria bacterium]
MQRVVKIPTLLGLIVLVAGLIGGIIMINSRQQVVTKVAASPTPQGVALSNITDRSFTVSWTTAFPATGFIKLMPQGKLSEKIILDDRDRDKGSQNKRTVHYVTVDSLTPSETYKFVIGGDNSQFDQNGSPFSVRIAQTLSSAPQSDIASGVILSENGQAAEGIIVYIQIPGGQLASALSGSDGRWAAPLSVVRTENGDSWLNYDLSATIYAVKADGGPEGIADAILTTAIDKPVPPLKLGNSYDFRQSKESVLSEGNKQNPSSEKPFSDETEINSLFDFSSLGPVTPLNEGLTLDNPKKEGEVIYTDKPEFFGSGSAGSSVEVVIESANTITGEIKVDGSGKWSFPATANLEDGNHTITLKWTDANGIVQVLKRSFVVNAASGRPAYVSTPSATPTSKSKTPTPTIPPNKSVPSTSSGIPKSGGLTQTVIIFMIGLTLVVTGLFSTVKPNKNLIK